MWCPPSFYRGSTKDVLATSGDYLRLWQSENKSTPELLSLLNKNKHSGILAFLFFFVVMLSNISLFPNAIRYLSLMDRILCPFD